MKAAGSPLELARNSQIGPYLYPAVAAEFVACNYDGRRRSGNGYEATGSLGGSFYSDDISGHYLTPYDAGHSNYSTWPNDKPILDDHQVGVSTFCGYSYNERSMLPLGVVDNDVEHGTEVTLVWGEEGGGSAKPVVERHSQVEIRAIVSPVPYAEVPRTQYAEGWRTKAASV